MFRHRLAITATVAALAAVSYLPLRATSAVQPTLPVAAFGTAAQSYPTLSGIVFDNTGGVLPGVKVRVTNFESQATKEVVTDRFGHFEFVGLIPGDYLREYILPGFSRQVSNLTMAWQDVQQDVALGVGSVEETINVMRGDVLGASSYSRDPKRDALQLECSDRRARNRAAKSSAVIEVATPVLPRVGGQIMAPVKVRNVPPQYPGGDSVAGTVVLSGVIEADGFLGDIQVESAAHPNLDSAAIDAVRQWEYHATLLNCVPIPVRMTVTVNFQNQQ